MDPSQSAVSEVLISSFFQFDTGLSGNESRQRNIRTLEIQKHQVELQMKTLK